MTQLSQESVERIVAFVRDGDRQTVTISDIVALADLMAQSFDNVFKAENVEAYGEFLSIAEAIANMKAEINELSAADIALNRIPGAGQELDAIISATESATNSIMESAEAMLGMDLDMDAASYRDAVEGECMKIFEACSFQDITGQRVSKIVETLKHIETRVSRFASALGQEAAAPVTLSDEEQAREQRKKDQILHGPQLEGEGVDQADIDAMMFDMDAAADMADLPQAEAPAPESDQGDIDALFGPDSGEPTDFDLAISKLTGTGG